MQYDIIFEDDVTIDTKNKKSHMERDHNVHNDHYDHNDSPTRYDNIVIRDSDDSVFEPSLGYALSIGYDRLHRSIPREQEETIRREEERKERQRILEVERKLKFERDQKALLDRITSLQYCNYITNLYEYRLEDTGKWLYNGDMQYLKVKTNIPIYGDMI